MKASLALCAPPALKPRRDRPARSRLVGRPPARPALAGARRAKQPTPTASGCPKSCCSRRLPQAARPISENFVGCGRASRRSPPLRSRRSCAPSPGSVIIPARATCTLARAKSRSAAAPFRGREAELRTLPGIGAYTAAAVAAIAFNEAAAPVDGNIARIVTRLEAIEQPIARAPPIAKAAAA